jgi:hypothetical protein
MKNEELRMKNYSVQWENHRFSLVFSCIDEPVQAEDRVNLLRSEVAASRQFLPLRGRHTTCGESTGTLSFLILNS